MWPTGWVHRGRLGPTVGCRRPSSRRSPSASVKACSTAFCRSSASTTASGVATSAGTSPSSPVTSKVSSRDCTTESSAIRISDVTISSKGTWSLGLAGQDLVDDGDGADPALGLEQRHPAPARAAAGGPAAARAPRWSAGCSSPGGGPPGWRRPWTAAAGRAAGRRSRRVAAPGTRSPRPSARRGMQWSSTVTSGRRSTSSTTGSAEARAHSMADSSIPRSVRRRPSIWEYMPIRWRALVAFGRGVADPALLVDQHHAVTDPRSLLGGHLLARETGRSTPTSITANRSNRSR